MTDSIDPAEQPFDRRDPGAPPDADPDGALPEEQADEVVPMAEPDGYSSDPIDTDTIDTDIETEPGIDGIDWVDRSHD